MSNLKGLNIVIGAETTGLDKALAGVNKRARESQSELRQVDRLLKLDPKNTDLVAQRQRILANNVEATREKLQSLRAAQAQVERQFKDGEIGEAQYRAFQREVIKTENELRRLQTTGKRTAAEIAASMTAAGKAMTTVGQKATAAGRTMTMGVTLPLVGIGVAAAQTAGQFEQTMNVLRVNSRATGDEMERLKQLAMETGEATVYSANESADAMLELSKGGLTPAQIEAGALASSMNLAATEGLALDQAATIVIRSMNTFGIAAEETGTVVDALASGAVASTAGVESLSEGMKYVGATAASAHVGIVDVVTQLALLNDAGLDGTTAGTSLNRMLLGLAGTTKKGAKVISEYNLEFYNQSGQLKSGVEIVAQLEKAFGSLNDQQRAKVLKDLFGVEGMRAANILLREGAGRYQELSTEVSRSGVAAEMAGARMSGMAGALERARGSVETAGLTIGEDLAPHVERAAEVVEELANAFTALPDGTKSTIISTAALLAVVGPAVWVFGSLATAAGSVAKAIGWVAGVSVKATPAVAGSGTAAGASSVGFDKLAGSSLRAAGGMDAVATSAPVAGAAAKTAGGTVAASGKAAATGWMSVLGPITLFVGALYLVADGVNKTIQFLNRYAGYGGTASRANEELLTSTEAAARGFTYQRDELDLLVSLHQDYKGTLEETTDAVDPFAGVHDKTRNALNNTKAATHGADKALDEYTETTEATTEATENLIRGLDGLETAADGVEGTMRTAADAQRDYRTAMLDAKEARKEVEALEKAGKKGTEEHTRATIEAAEAEQRAADARGENIDAIHKLNVALVTGSSETTSMTVEQSKLVDELDTASERVATLTSKLDRVPKSKRSKIEAEIKDAEKKLEEIRAKISGIPSSKNVEIRVSATGGGKVRAVVDGKITQFIVNADGGVYDEPSHLLVGETNEREYVINSARLRRGDARQIALLAGLMQDSALVRSPSRVAGLSQAFSSTSDQRQTVFQVNGVELEEARIVQSMKTAIYQAAASGTYIPNN